MPLAIPSLSDLLGRYQLWMLISALKKAVADRHGRGEPKVVFCKILAYGAMARDSQNNWWFEPDDQWNQSRLLGFFGNSAPDTMRVHVQVGDLQLTSEDVADAAFAVSNPSTITSKGRNLYEIEEVDPMGGEEAQDDAAYVVNVAREHLDASWATHNVLRPLARLLYYFAVISVLLQIAWLLLDGSCGPDILMGGPNPPSATMKALKALAGVYVIRHLFP